MGDTVRNGLAQQRRIEGLLAELVLSALRKFNSAHIRALCAQGKLLTLEPGTSVRVELLGDFLILDGLLTRSAQRHTLGEVECACTGALVRSGGDKLPFVQAASPSQILCLPAEIADSCSALQDETPVRALGSGPLVISDLS